MTEAVKAEAETYLANFEGLETAFRRESPWLRDLRRRSLERFAELGFPTIRDEDWRYTNVAPIARTTFQAPTQVDPRALAERLKRAPLVDLESPKMVFVNGAFSPELSSLQALSPALRVSSLSEALAESPEELEPHLARYSGGQDNAFSALNTSFMRDGTFIHVPAGTVVEDPIQLLYISFGSEAQAPFVTHPRNLIVVEPNSQLVVFETHLGIENSAYLTNSVVELSAGENSVVDYYRLQQESAEALHVSTTHIQQAGNSTVRSHFIDVGGALVRNGLSAVLGGEGADTTFNGLYLVSSRRLVDNHTRLEHAAPHCNSRELYKGILRDKSRAVFHGRIVVQPGAQKTDSKQTNSNLLLSDEALVNTKPQLEIYADDVKCTHGATIGQLDEGAIFYLRSRGISKEAARSMLVHGFAKDMIGQVRLEPLRQQLSNLLFEWLPQGRLLKEAMVP